MSKTTLRLSLTLFICLGSICLSENRSALMTFEQFKERFQKTYDTQEQESKRRAVFAQNRKNAQQSVNCSACGITQFSDLTDQEFENQFLTVKQIENKPTPQREMVHVEGEIELQPEDQLYARVGSVGSASTTGIDWRELNTVTSIKNQKSCGSCWTFTVAAATESFAIIQGQANISLDLSEQYLLECTSGSSCNGGVIEHTMDLVIERKGMPYQSSYPYNYTSYYGSDDICNAALDQVNPADRRVSKYDVGDEEIIEYLSRSPLAIDLSATGWSSYAPSSASSSNAQKILTCTATAQVNHGVLLVGHTDEYWVVKNSWGETWGDSGYAYVSRDRTNNRNCRIGNAIHIWADECALENCILCELGRVSCEECAPGYYQEDIDSTYDYKCVPCIDPNCHTCYHTRYSDSVVGQCQLCASGWSLDYSNTRKCYQIGIENCEKFWISGGNTYCYACDVGYVRSSNYQQCTKCGVENCHQCQRDTLDVCDTCQEGYELANGGSSCTFKCVQNCASGCLTEAYKCDRCYDGFYGESCSLVECDVQNCNGGCTIANICDQCLPGWSGNDCSTQQAIIECDISNCAAGCSQPNVCINCDVGYIGDDCSFKEFVQCNVENCALGCSVENVCDECDSGYSGSDCKTIECSVSNCKSGCIEPNICGSCDGGYSGDNCDIVQCLVENCRECGAPNYCQQCESGYSVNNGTGNCLPFESKCSIDRCLECSTEDGSVYQCEKCESGYKGIKCSRFDCDVVNCKTCSAPNVCKQCQAGWTGENCAEPCCHIDNCVTCSGPNVCEACEEGFSGEDCLTKSVMESTGCYPDVVNCQIGCSKDPSKCDLCDHGFYGDSCMFDKFLLAECQECMYSNSRPLSSSSSSASSSASSGSDSSSSSDLPAPVSVDNYSTSDSQTTSSSDSLEHELAEKEETIQFLEMAIIVVLVLLLFSLIGVITLSVYLIKLKKNIYLSSASTEPSGIEAMLSAGNLRKDTVEDKPIGPGHIQLRHGN